MRRWLRVLGVLPLLLCCSASRCTASDLSVDVAARLSLADGASRPRDDARAAQCPVSRVCSNDVDYEYRQDSNLYYLTGMTQEDTVLVLMPGNTTRREFCLSRSQSRAQHWTGRLMTHTMGRRNTGISTILSPCVRRLHRQHAESSLSTWLNIDQKSRGVLRGRRAKGGGRHGRAQAGAPRQPMQTFLRGLARAMSVRRGGRDAAFTALRLVKTYELQMLSTATTISADCAGCRHAGGGTRCLRVSGEAAIEISIVREGARCRERVSVDRRQWSPAPRFFTTQKSDRQMRLANCCSSMRLPTSAAKRPI